MLLTPVPRREILLSESWRFSVDREGAGERDRWFSMDFSPAEWEPVQVPHTWNVTGRYENYEGIAWYRCEFFCPPGAVTASGRLRFDAVFYLARIWLNETFLGEHEGGYTPFEYEITSLLSSEKKNTLVVQVDNRRAIDRLPAHLFESRSYGWKNYGGIVRDVKLILTSRIFLGTPRVFCEPHLPELNRADWTLLTAQIPIRNDAGENFNGQLNLIFCEETSGKVAASLAKPIALPQLSDRTISIQTTLLDPLLWHFDHPHLYRCIASLTGDDGQEYDRIATTFGIRKIECKNGRFMLNGEAVRLAGLSRHADIEGYGLAEPPEIMRADLDDMKRLNMVLGRPVHYPQHEYVYDYCDRHGILLCPELPAWQLTALQLADERMKQLARQQLIEMVAASANHPCIWAWSVGNELESDTVAGRMWVREMVDFLHSLDPTRPVSFASFHLLGGRPWADATQHVDFVMMNQYFGTWHGPKDCLPTSLDVIHQTWPEKTIIVSEFGFAPHWQKIEGPALIDPLQYYLIPEDAAVDSPEADLQRQMVIREQMAVYRTRPFIAGAVYWAYRGNMGVMDSHNHMRPSWHTLRQEFTPLFIEAVAFSKDADGKNAIEVCLRTRGPVECDLPAYTLWAYHLSWEVISTDTRKIIASGEIDLPDLAPGTRNTFHLPGVIHSNRGELRIIVHRPTGYAVAELNVEIPSTN